MICQKIVQLVFLLVIYCLLKILLSWLIFGLILSMLVFLLHILMLFVLDFFLLFFWICLPLCRLFVCFHCCWIFLLFLRLLLVGHLVLICFVFLIIFVLLGVLLFRSFGLFLFVWNMMSSSQSLGVCHGLILLGVLLVGCFVLLRNTIHSVLCLRLAMCRVIRLFGKRILLRIMSLFCLCFCGINVVFVGMGSLRV